MKRYVRLGVARDDRADGEVRPSRHDVDHGAGEEEVELAALDLARRVVRAARLAPGRAVLRHARGVDLEEVRVGAHVHDGGEPGVRGRAVVALEEVLRGDLPVAVELGLRALEEAQRGEVDPRVRDPLGDAVEVVVERLCIRVRVDEEERPPGLEAERNEPELVLVDPALLVPARRGDEAAVEPVRPRVVRALERLAPARALAHERAAVAADVEERTQRVLLVAHEDDRNVPDGRGRERAGLGHVALVPDVLPRAPEDALALELEHGRIRVPAPGQRLELDGAHRREATAGEAETR